GSPQAATIVVASSTPGSVSNIMYGASSTVPTNAGTYAVTASFVPTDTTDYTTLTGLSAGNFVIKQATQTIAFGTAPTVVVGSNGTVSATGGASGNAVMFNSTTTTICTTGGTNGSTVTGVIPGTCTIQATQAGNTNYA